MNQIEQAEINKLRERLTGAAQGMAASAAWVDRYADALAKIGVGNFGVALLSGSDEEALTFYVYGDDAQSTQTFAAVRELLPGKWESARTATSEELCCEINDDGYIVEFTRTTYKTAPVDGAESKV